MDYELDKRNNEIRFLNSLRGAEHIAYLARSGQTVLVNSRARLFCDVVNLEVHAWSKAPRETEWPTQYNVDFWSAGHWPVTVDFDLWIFTSWLFGQPWEIRMFDKE